MQAPSSPKGCGPALQLQHSANDIIPLQQEALGHSGFQPRGQQHRMDNRSRPTSALAASRVSLDGRGALGSEPSQPSPLSPTEGPLQESMTRLDQQLHALLQEQRRRNDLNALNGGLSRGPRGDSNSNSNSGGGGLEPLTAGAAWGRAQAQRHHSSSPSLVLPSRRPALGGSAEASSPRTLSPLRAEPPATPQLRSASFAVRMPLGGGGGGGGAGGQTRGALFSAGRTPLARPSSRPSVSLQVESPKSLYQAEAGPGASGSRLRVTQVDAPAEGDGLGSRWGVSEGGRDGLGWVRSLVRLTETHPIRIPEGRSSSVEPDPEGGFRSTVFPSAKPNRREDVVLLQMWLEEMMQQVQGGSLLAGPGASYSAVAAQQLHQKLLDGLPYARTQDPGAGSDPDLPPSPKTSPTAGPGWGLGQVEAPAAAASGLELTEGALHVYVVAFEELKRQVSSDCKDRGDLLSILLEHLTSLLQLQASFRTEERLSEVQEQNAALHAGAEAVKQEMKLLVSTQKQQALELEVAMAGEAAVTQSLANRVSQQQKELFDMKQLYEATNGALKEEVQRRLEAVEQLSQAHEALHKSNLALQQAAKETHRLSSEEASLQQQVQELRRSLDLSQAATEAAHAQTRGHLQERANTEVEMMCIKGQYGTDGIVMAGLEQQVQELKGQLVQVKGHAKYHLKHVGDSNSRLDFLTDRITSLEAELGAEQAERRRLDVALAASEGSARQLAAALAALEETARRQAAGAEAELREKRDAVTGLSTDLRHLGMRSEDLEHRLKVREAGVAGLEEEVSALRGMMQGMADRMWRQGAEGVPLAGDPGWQVLGSAGSLRKCTAAAAKQVDALFSRNLAQSIEIAGLAARLEEELTRHKVLQKEAHQARASEAAAMRQVKEATAAAQAAQAQSERHRESEDAALSALHEAKGKIGSLNKTIEALNSELDYSRPFEGKLSVSEALCQETEARRVALTVELERAREEVQSLKELQDYLKKEIDALILTNHELTDRVKMLAVVEHELEEMTIWRNAPNDENDLLQNRMEEALNSAAEALQQLQVSKFLLQGVSSDQAQGGTSSPPLSPRTAFLRPLPGATPPTAAGVAARAASSRHPPHRARSPRAASSPLPSLPLPPPPPAPAPTPQTPTAPPPRRPRSPTPPGGLSPDSTAPPAVCSRQPLPPAPAPPLPGGLGALMGN